MNARKGYVMEGMGCTDAAARTAGGLRAAAGTVALFAALVRGSSAQAAPPASGGEYPTIEIARGALALTLYVPDPQRGYYRGSRFDWSGLMAQARLGETTFFGEFMTPHDPTGHDHVSGPAEEFGMDSPPGYAAAPVGGPFLKIGVGLLEKIAEKNYRFFHRYRIFDGGAWRVEKGPGWAEFVHELAGGRWAYRYAKRIAIEDAPGPREASFVIDRTLRNTGREAIETDHYCHNFFVIDGRPVGPGYVLRFPFEPRAQLDSKAAELASLRGSELVLLTGLAPGKALWMHLEGFDPAMAGHNRVALELASSGAGVEIAGDRPLSKLVVYATREALCPEPFVKIACAPGAETGWRTRYRLYLRSTAR